jgi:tetratricopeptide (TPR) repeat protein
MATENPAATESTAQRQQLEAVFAAVSAGDITAATSLAVATLARKVEHPVLLSLRALDYENAGRFNEALVDLRRAHVLAPTDPTILNACGLCLVRMDRWEEAWRCYDKAVALKPDFGQAWFNRGYVLERMGEVKNAALSYARAVEIHPQNVQAWANMAMLASRRGDATETRRCAERALALQPAQPTAVLALTAIETDDFADAERRLRSLLDQQLSDFDRALALGQIADALDAQNKPAQAFDAYTASNRLFYAALAPRFAAPGKETVPDVYRWLNLWADLFDASNWVVDPDETSAIEGMRGHVFLVGFPRSGTTLMESFIAAHPDVVSLEERETLTNGVLAYLSSSKHLTRLTVASGPELAALREDYWRRVRSFGADPTGKIFIDKNPFNTLKLPLILKLFPAAKVIFARRDPREVVLSCFRRRFGFNPSTFQFLDLKATAENYDASMRLAETMRAKLPYSEHILVFEKLIADFETEAKAACAFIGAEWRLELIDFADRAKRGEVASASAAQIARGLYTEGTAHWRRYAAQLAAVEPILAPWVKRYGYEAG